MANGEEKSSDFYAVLGLNKECTATELRNAYKKLALVRVSSPLFPSHPFNQLDGPLVIWSLFWICLFDLVSIRVCMSFFMKLNNAMKFWVVFFFFLLNDVWSIGFSYNWKTCLQFTFLGLYLSFIFSQENSFCWISSEKGFFFFFWNIEMASRSLFSFRKCNVCGRSQEEISGHSTRLFWY